MCFSFEEKQIKFLPFSENAGELRFGLYELFDVNFLEIRFSIVARLSSFTETMSNAVNKPYDSISQLHWDKSSDFKNHSNLLVEMMDYISSRWSRDENAYVQVDFNRLP